MEELRYQDWRIFFLQVSRSFSNHLGPRNQLKTLVIIKLNHISVPDIFFNWYIYIYIYILNNSSLSTYIIYFLGGLRPPPNPPPSRLSVPRGGGELRLPPHQTPHPRLAKLTRWTDKKQLIRRNNILKHICFQFFMGDVFLNNLVWTQFWRPGTWKFGFLVENYVYSLIPRSKLVFPGRNIMKLLF